MKRIDIWLVDLGLAPSRTKAQELIKTGMVEIKTKDQWEIIKSASAKYLELQANQLQLKDDQLLKFVARSGLKLEGALHLLSVNPKGKTCLDVGQSTGGFTDCLLQAEAKHVVGFDVGHDQLSEKIKAHPGVTFFEGIHGKEATSHSSLSGFLGQIDLLVMDVSFISVTKLAKDAMKFLRAKGELLILIKPQFELGAEALNKNGIVESPVHYEGLERNMIDFFRTTCGVENIQYIESPLGGHDGNREFFVYGTKS